MPPTSKRQRKKQFHHARQQAVAAAERRRRNRVRFVAVGLIVALGAGLAGLAAALGSDDKKKTTKVTTSATTVPKATAGSTTVPAPAVGCAPTATEAAKPRIDFDAAPPMTIDVKKTYRAVFTTSEGTVEVDLDTKRTPVTANNFVFLARQRYYDGTRIFRTDPSIDIIQGGAPHTNGPSDKGPGYTIKDEGGTFTYRPGDLVMARTSQPNSGGAQFFFATGPKVAGLDAQGTYVTFARTTKGLDVLQKIIGLNKDNPSSGLGGAPSRPVTVCNVTIEES